MHFGIQLNPYHAGSAASPWDSVERAARAVDATAFDSLWLYDHFLYEGGYAAHPIPEPVLECFTTLGAIAALTNRVRLGQLVLGVPYRNPALVTKMATTLDHISRGRSILGLGAAWHKREYEAYGWGAFEDGPTRLRRLEEALQVVRALWTERPSTFRGAHYSLDSVKDSPLPLQQPHPPIMIAGSGEKVTLRLVAQYGQMCNVMGSPSDVERLFGILKEHCERLDQPYDDVTRSIYTTLLIGETEHELAAKKARLGEILPASTVMGTPDVIIDYLAQYARAGCQYVIYRTPDWFDVEPLQLFSEGVIPALASV
ncbi:MAG: TIGR03560 family F420-dependent LLM class oxidoreductase [Chloroflexota bacterium]